MKDYMKNPSDPLWAIKALQEILTDDTLPPERRESINKDIKLITDARAKYYETKN